MAGLFMAAKGTRNARTSTSRSAHEIFIWQQHPIQAVYVTFINGVKSNATYARVKETRWTGLQSNSELERCTTWWL